MHQTWNNRILSLVFAGALLGSCATKEDHSEGEWTVPEPAAAMANPLQKGPDHLREGQVVYRLYCETCHGTTGLGDGPAGQALGGHPANLQSEVIQSQTDGTLFFKLSVGRGVMPAFQEVLTETQRWQLVHHLRSLKNTRMEGDSATLPQALVPGISISRWARVAPRAVRIWTSQDGHYLWYATLPGEVYRLSTDRSRAPEKMLDVSDHGIPRLQGATWWKDRLFLSGNVRVNDNKGTKGRLVRVGWDAEGKPNVEVVFTTEVYGTTNTPFDHGWSALQISADEEHLFVVSGSRTDHGEVQDNLGAYPNARDAALTSKIFRIPLHSKDLSLPNDLDSLKAMGVLFAEGVRNAYDLALDQEGRLIAVVNSGDYDQNEDMIWVREGHHYGYPWTMGGMETPQQFPDWVPDPDTDPFLNPGAAAWPNDFHNDPDFPRVPEGIRFTPGFLNFGPDADKFRDKKTGLVRDASDLGIGMTTFTPHSSPLGLVFDTEERLPGRFKGKALVLRYTNGQRSALMQPFTPHGEDLLLLDLELDGSGSNFLLNTYRVAEGFTQPVDAVLLGKSLYVIEYGGREKGGNLWNISFE
ncbi:c-type cytochrome [Cyclobacterium xiamenense]|uniref:c-type cytochrome n=1 Tax=Cyclobacterium xiamenense TaxID=1297121 RepID=UPI0035D0454D